MKIKKISILTISFLCFHCAPKPSEETPRILPSPQASSKVTCSLNFDKKMNPLETATRAIEIKQICNLSEEQILNLAREVLN